MACRVVLLPGDGIGPEVTRQAWRVLEAVTAGSGLSIQGEEHVIGGAALAAGQPALPETTLAAVMTADAVLLGAVGDPRFDHMPPESRPEKGLLTLRKAMGVYANLRPAKAWPGLESAGPLKPDVLAGTDMIVLRELLGGLYYGEPRGWDKAAGQAVNTLPYSKPEVERIAKVAFTLARQRRKHVTSVDKANVLETSQLWRAVVTDVARKFPDVTLTHEYVDACAMKLAYAPSSFDIVLTENLFGDILSDEAGAICGSLGLLPSASLGDGPGLFEPVHGSAPTIAGRGIANPTGAILSAAMLLRWGLKRDADATVVEQAVSGTLAAGLRTADIAAAGDVPVSTSAFGDAVVARVKAARAG